MAEAVPEKIKSPVARIENAIIERLKSTLDEEFFIDRYPDQPEGFDFAGYKKALLVHYVGKKHQAGGVGSASASKQSRFAIHFTVRNLRDDGGAYEVIDFITASLQADRIEGGQIQILEDSLQGQAEGLWHWIIDLVHTGYQSASIQPRTQRGTR